MNAIATPVRRRAALVEWSAVAPLLLAAAAMPAGSACAKQGPPGADTSDRGVGRTAVAPPGVPAEAGARCFARGPSCAPGLECRCAEPTPCGSCADEVPGSCVAVLPAGAPCGEGDCCADAGVCGAGHCAVRRGPGESCGDDEDCRPGLCLSGRCLGFDGMPLDIAPAFLADGVARARAREAEGCLRDLAASRKDQVLEATELTWEWQTGYPTATPPDIHAEERARPILELACARSAGRPCAPDQLRVVAPCDPAWFRLQRNVMWELAERMKVDGLEEGEQPSAEFWVREMTPERIASIRAQVGQGTDFELAFGPAVAESPSAAEGEAGAPGDPAVQVPEGPAAARALRELLDTAAQVVTALAGPAETRAAAVVDGFVHGARQATAVLDYVVGRYQAFERGRQPPSGTTATAGDDNPTEASCDAGRRLWMRAQVVTLFLHQALEATLAGGSAEHRRRAFDLLAGRCAEIPPRLRPAVPPLLESAWMLERDDAVAARMAEALGRARTACSVP